MPDRVLAALNADVPKAHVFYKNAGKKYEWFGPEPDMRPINEFYAYVTSLKP